jgi:hypothetical protein
LTENNKIMEKRVLIAGVKHTISELNTVIQAINPHIKKGMTILLEIQGSPEPNRFDPRKSSLFFYKIEEFLKSKGCKVIHGPVPTKQNIEIVQTKNAYTRKIKKEKNKEKLIELVQTNKSLSNIRDYYFYPERETEGANNFVDLIKRNRVDLVVFGGAHSEGIIPALERKGIKTKTIFQKKIPKKMRKAARKSRMPLIMKRRKINIHRK